MSRLHEHMASHGGVLRHCSLFAAAAGGAMSVLAILTKDGGLFGTDYVGLVLALYLFLLQALSVLYEWPGDRFGGTQAAVHAFAPGLSHITARGYFFVFLGALLASHFTDPIPARWPPHRGACDPP